MDTATLTVVIGAVVTVGGTLANFVGMAWNRRKVNADADVSVSSAWEKLNAPLLKRIDDQDRLIASLTADLKTEKEMRRVAEDTVFKLQARMARLEGQVASFGGTPVP